MSYHSSTRIRSSSKLRRGFTLVEIIIAVTIIGILAAATYQYMPTIFSQGGQSSVKDNANTLNKTVANLLGSGTTFTQGTYAFTNGTATAGAAVTLPAASTSAAITSFATQLSGTGVTSWGHVSKLASPVTAASYTYAWTGTAPNQYPVFSAVAGATAP